MAEGKSMPEAAYDVDDVFFCARANSHRASLLSAYLTPSGIRLKLDRQRASDCNHWTCSRNSHPPTGTE